LGDGVIRGRVESGHAHVGERCPGRGEDEPCDKERETAETAQFAGSVHRCTVTVMGIWKEAPWQPLAELVLMEAPFGIWTTTPVPVATVTLSPADVGTVTPEFAAVQPVPPVTDTVPPRFWEMPTMVTE